MLRALGALVCVVALAVPVGLYLLATEVLTRYELVMMPVTPPTVPTVVTVERGASARDAIAALHRAGVIADVPTALGLLRRSGKDRGIHAGDYVFERAMMPSEVLEKLIKGDVQLRTITFPEGLHRFELAERYAAAGLGSAEDFLSASADTSLIADLDPDAEDLEGYLFPDTYALGSADGAETLVARMVDGFRRAIGDGAGERSAELGLSLREVVILASLVEKETARADERTLVSGVYMSRLRRRMLMQADPTVIYGLLREGRFDGNLTRAHLRERAPYNTYVNPGLPPGPIANPGKAALDAALAPADTEFLYFVSRNDGSHVFSRDLREHNRQVEIFQKRYWREKWRRDREAKSDSVTP